MHDAPFSRDTDVLGMTPLRGAHEMQWSRAPTDCPEDPEFGRRQKLGGDASVWQRVATFLYCWKIYE